MQKSLRLFLIPLVLLLSVTVAQADKGGNGKGNDHSGKGKGKPTMTRFTLKPVGSDTDASGFAETTFRANKKGGGGGASEQSLHIKVEKVAGNSMFTITIDGNDIDSFTSNP